MNMTRQEFFATIFAAVLGKKYWTQLKAWLKPKPLYDPTLIALIRKAFPKLLAIELCKIQPMSAPTGLLFAWSGRAIPPKNLL
jgi:hypothetical protein